MKREIYIMDITCLLAGKNVYFGLEVIPRAVKQSFPLVCSALLNSNTSTPKKNNV